MHWDNKIVSLAREDDFKQRVIASKPELYSQIFDDEEPADNKFYSPSNLAELNALMIEWEAQDSLNALGVEGGERTEDTGAPPNITLDPGLDLPIGFDGVPGIDWSLFE